MAEKKTVLEERVPMFVPLDRNDKQTYVVISINGKKYQIEKGKEVSVPKSVKAIWDASQREEDMLDQKLRDLENN